ncbi:MAG: hypothetical protein H6832_14540 [Planctomycetes bacterium]|nr:hypothetical protein [Planctomycetota bacterium]
MRMNRSLFNNFRRLQRPLAYGLIGLLTACVSVDSERNQMMSAIDKSEMLSREITSWRSSLPADVSETAVANIQAFQERAETASETLESVSDEALAGVDVTGLCQALDSVAQFDTSTFAPASATSRRALLDQFSGLARNLENSVTLTKQRIGS